MHFQHIATVLSALSALRTNSEEMKTQVKTWAPQAITGVSMVALTCGLIHYRHKYSELQEKLDAMANDRIRLQTEVATIRSIRDEERVSAATQAADLTVTMERERQLKEALAQSADAKEKVELEQLYWVNQINAMQDRIYRLEAELNGTPVFPITQPQPPTAGLHHLASDMRSQMDYYRRNNIRFEEAEM